METPERVIIVGAGVGGLSTAAALKKVGHRRRRVRSPSGAHRRRLRPDLVERHGRAARARRLRDDDRARPRDGGAGLPNGAGEGDDARAGRELARSHGSLPPVNIRRLDMIKTVFESLDEGIVRFGTKCVGFEQDDAGVTVRFEDGSEERGASSDRGRRHPVDRSGSSSAVAPARASGAQVTRALLPFEHPAIPAGTFILTFGGPSRFGLIHTSPDVLCWFGIFLAPPGTKDGPGRTEGRAAGALPRLPGADRRRDRRHAGGDDLPRRHLRHRPPVDAGVTDA